MTRIRQLSTIALASIALACAAAPAQATDKKVDGIHPAEAALPG
jgi:hypothetical protein